MEKSMILFREELKKLYYIKKQLLTAWPKLAGQAHDPLLAQSLRDHLAATAGQVKRLEDIFDRAGVKPEATPVGSFDALVKEGQMAIGMIRDETLTDVFIAGQALTVERLEAALYEELTQLALMMGWTDSSRLLQQSLGETLAAGETFTRIGGMFIARGVVGSSEVNPQELLEPE